MIYVKAIPLRTEKHLATILKEAISGNIVIFNIGDLLGEEKIREAEALINTLVEESQKRNLDIGRLGSFRGIICPKEVKIWREE